MTNEYTLSTDPTTVSFAGGATTICVRVESDSVSDVLVQVPQIHGDDWYLVRKGEAEYFRVGFKELTTATLKGSGGAATCRCGAVGATSHPMQ